MSKQFYIKVKSNIFKIFLLWLSNNKWCPIIWDFTNERLASNLLFLRWTKPKVNHYNPLTRAIGSTIITCWLVPQIPKSRNIAILIIIIIIIIIFLLFFQSKASTDHLFIYFLNLKFLLFHWFFILNLLIYFFYSIENFELFISSSINQPTLTNFQNFWSKS